ncbi:ATP-binding protein [Kutzneria sp. CA-103260]|uniref:ATP-binding protein n=1 Tax=Kutzneria sp. CA-103260 TaxID=2802641 RepID=UPI001BABA2F6|nr:LuxR C-terminal-related transcriptional regulator [Kutzneria sp. CA-103260]QUQ72323.1 LuxR family transcriptional regulator [Kutzneria sp. CA-103260]
MDGTLPAELTSFVGRRDEVVDVQRLLATSRLLTLTGPGGVGKTRLAVRVAARMRRSVRDGVRFVDLTGVRDEALLGQTVATALGLGGHAEDPVAQLAEHVEGRDLLVVLDNCEHLTRACASLVGRLLTVPGSTRVLATSRHLLDVAGEQVCPVPPLPVADAGVRLFLDRAAAVVPDFELAGGDHEQVRAICAALDGMPLAIELAAVRVRTLPLSAVRTRLDDCLRLLVGGDRSGPAHQRTLAATITWSYDLCSPDEQLLWRRLSVFHGGITLDAVHEVCADDDLPGARVLGLVDGLVDKSVLLPAAGEQARYRMQDTVRQFGFAQLGDAGERELAQRRHRDHFRRLARRCVGEMTTSQSVVHQRLVAECANFRAAAQWSVEHEPRLALDIVASLGIGWLCFGMVEEGRHWFARVLALDPDPSPQRAMVLWGNAIAVTVQGNRSTATDLLAQCRALADHLGDDKFTAMTVFAHALDSLAAGDNTAARAGFAEAVERIDAAGALAGTACVARACLACAMMFDGDIADAKAVAEEALLKCEQTGEQWARSYVLYALALVAWAQGDSGEAVAVAGRGVRVAHRFSDLISLSMLMELLAWIAVSDGDHEVAAERFGAVSRIWQLVGGRTMTAWQNLRIPHGRAEAEARAALGDEAFEVSFGTGVERALDIDHAVAHVLGGGGTRRSPAWGLLTRREIQVAELLGGGLANQEIAARLTISRRTAEGHVNNVLVKLGFSSRAQVAAWLAERCVVDR